LTDAAATIGYTVVNAGAHFTVEPSAATCPMISIAHDPTTDPGYVATVFFTGGSNFANDDGAPPQRIVGSAGST
jgi:hypothetical protein